MKKVIAVVVVMMMMAMGISFANWSMQSTTDLTHKEQILVGTTNVNLPYAYRVEHGTLTGYDIAVWKEIGERLDKQVVFVEMDQDSLFTEMDHGRIDTVANQLVINDELIQRYYVTDTHSAYPISKSSDGEELLAGVNNALRDMWKDGTMDSLSLEWLN